MHRLLLLGAAARLLPPSRLLAQVASPDDLAQPFAAATTRLLTALEQLGTPLPEAAILNSLLAAPGPDIVSRIEAILTPHVLLDIAINPESRIAVTRGPAPATLVEHGWRTFLLRVSNAAHDTSVLEIHSEQALPMGRPSGNETSSVHDFTIGAVDALRAEGRWLELAVVTRPPLQLALSGLDLEYRILQLYSRDHGRREASLEVLTAQGEQDLGLRSTVPILFNCLPASSVQLRILEADGSPSVASLVITDTLGRLYPARGKRALPDLWFQPQIYRRDGETLTLPEGRYTVTFGRGPEYLQHSVPLQVTSTTASLALTLDRWIDPARFGYFSGDSHIHAAGCSHYESPGEGVTPEVMRLQVEGEALDLGAVLTWAPGFLYQSQFFTGHVRPAPENHSAEHGTHHQHLASTATTPRSSTEPTLRYDLEVSGFPSSHCGHLVLLKLRDQRYPGTTMPDDWPSWNLPILQWAKSQGAITGYAHSGHGMVVRSTGLPNHLVPAFDSCGANEYLVDITHPGLLDFISGCDLWPFVELNLWYHVLNCGFPLNFAGETDFPCITDHCVGGGRTYVALDTRPAGDAGYAAWLTRGLEHGHSYFGDGRSHIFNLRIQTSSADTSARTRVHVTATIVARLEPTPTAETERIRHTSPYDRPFWHLERAREGSSRTVPLDLVVNGLPLQTVSLLADGQPHPVSFDLTLDRSSWIALRILPSSHTNPVTVSVLDKPVRASAASARWCRAGVDVCWSQKAPRIRQSERAAAAAAYDHARAAYDRILAESPA